MCIRDRRDVTATIENDGLIAASIMAKKVASGTSALVLDIKVGRGAFMRDLERARGLGRLCRLIGDAYERPTTCIYTGMDAPLGRTVGNRLEAVSYTHLRAHETVLDLVCRLLLEKKKQK